jgi:flagellar protein FlaG
MSMEISQVLVTHRPDGTAGRVQSAQVRELEAAARAQSQLRSNEAARAAQVAMNRDLGRAVDELRRVSQVFDRKLSFSYNEDLNQVIVKVIDRETDTVIKELPPDALQRVHMRIREAIGLLIDETV